MKLNFKQGGFAFSLVKHENSICLYRGENPSGMIQFEVHLLKWKTPFHSDTPALTNPSPSDWGKYGFTYNDEGKALSKYEELVSSTTSSASMTVTTKSSVPCSLA